MYRVVTKLKIQTRGLQRIQVDAGPWQPSEKAAQRWAEVFKATGHYYAVYVESNRRNPDGTQAAATQAPAEVAPVEEGVAQAAPVEAAPDMAQAAQGAAEVAA